MGTDHGLWVCVMSRPGSSLASYTGSVYKVISGLIRIESVVPVIFDVQGVSLSNLLLDEVRVEREYPREDLTKSHNVLREPIPGEGRLQMKGLKASLGRLETRLDCIELAKEQTRGRVTLYSIRRRENRSSK